MKEHRWKFLRLNSNHALTINFCRINFIEYPLDFCGYSLKESAFVPFLYLLKKSRIHSNKVFAFLMNLYVLKYNTLFSKKKIEHKKGGDQKKFIKMPKGDFNKFISLTQCLSLSFFFLYEHSPDVFSSFNFLYSLAFQLLSFLILKLFTVLSREVFFFFFG